MPEKSIEKVGTPSNSSEEFKQKSFLLNSLATSTNKSVQESKEFVERVLSFDKSQINIAV